MKSYRKPMKQTYPSQAAPITFDKILDMWQNVYRVKHKGATEVKYANLINVHIKPELGKNRVSDITVEVLNAFAEQKLKNGRKDKKGGLSPSYVRSMMIIISSAMNFAVRQGLCNPLPEAAFKPPIEKSAPKTLSEEERQLLEDYLFTQTDLTKLGVLISMYCGLRIGEVCALKWSDVDLDRRMIFVQNTVARVMGDNGKQTRFIIDKAKTTASVRQIPIHTRLLGPLVNAKKNTVGEYVVSNTASFVKPRSFEYRYHRLLCQCGLRPVNFHALRHTFATRCVECGMDPKMLSEILGHAGTATTFNIYVHPSIEMKIRQIEKLGTVFSQNS